MLVLSEDLVLSAEDAALPAGTPLIGWHNVVIFGGIAADTTETGYPASNLSNPATSQYWKAADTTEQYLTVTTGTVDEIDYVGIAGHNFATAGIGVSIGYFDTGPVWVELSPEQVPPDDGPMLFRFTPQALTEIAIKLPPGTEAARAAVVYVGKLLVCERGPKVDDDYAPPQLGRKTQGINGRSERGDYLGRIVTSRWIETQFAFAHFTPDWYRSEFDPFVQAAIDDTPFFYAWKPESYPYEVGYLWLTDDPVPLTSPVTGRISVTLKVGGIVA
jgi:hypothetical protein